MDIINSIILGLIQGLTEFLPVSSSGHLVLAQHFLGMGSDSDTSFEIMVHAATVLATIRVFGREIFRMLSGGLKFKYNDESKYLLKIALSMVPVLIVGLFFKKDVEALFNSTVAFIGAMLLITAVVLTAGHFISKYRRLARPITYGDAFVIGLAQAVAVVPGISRSGSTIATGMMLGNDKASLAKFSFLMVLVPILGEAFLDIVGGDMTFTGGGLPMLAGFVAAYLSGLFACKVMINIVAKGKLYYFAIYCAIIGASALIWG